MKTIHTRIDCLAMRLNDLMTHIYGNCTISITQDDEKYLLRLLNWIPSFSCVITHPKLRKSEFVQHYQRNIAYIKTFKDRLNFSRDMPLPKTKIQTGYLHSLIDKVFDESNDILHYCTRIHTFADMDHLFFALDICKTITTLQCPLMHNNEFRVDNIDAYDRLMAILHLRIFQMTNFKYNDILALEINQRITVINK